MSAQSTTLPVIPPSPPEAAQAVYDAMHTPEDAPAVTATAAAPTPTVKGKGKTSTKGTRPADPTIAAKAAAERARRRAALEKNRTLTSDQKETASALINADAPIVFGQSADDKAIYGFTVALKKGDKYTESIRPALWNKRPIWLSESDWNKAKRAFDRVYESKGVSAFDRDADGRLILPIPWTAGRYGAAVLAGDVENVLRYAGTIRPSADGAAFSALAPLDDIAPTVSAVYRAGAVLNATSETLGRAQKALDAAPAARVLSARKRVDIAVTARDAARKAFVTAYTAALASADKVSAHVLKLAGDALAVYVAGDGTVTTTK